MGEKRRAQIAYLLYEEVSVAPTSRLLTVIDQAMRWQKSQGLLLSGIPFDIFQNRVLLKKHKIIERIPTEMDKLVKLGGKKFHLESLCFSPDGTMLVTGSVDGFIEVRDAFTIKLKKDLQ